MINKSIATTHRPHIEEMIFVVVDLHIAVEHVYVPGVVG